MENSRTFQGLREPWVGLVVEVVAVFVLVVVVSVAVVLAVVVVVVVVVLVVMMMMMVVVMMTIMLMVTFMHQCRYLLVPQRRPSHVIERTAASIAFRSAK